jgi:hypothetical protein
MSKFPPPPPQIRPGAVLGSEALPFESMIFAAEAAKTDEATENTPLPGSSEYVSTSSAGRHLTEAPRPVVSKLFRPGR